MNHKPLSKRTVLVTVKVSLFTNRKTAKSVERKVAASENASDDAVVVKKRMFRSDKYTQIVSTSTAIRKHFYKYALPWRDGGTRIIPSALWIEFINKLRQLTTRFNTLVDEFVTDLPKIIDQQRGRLGDLFDLSQYPTQSEMRDKFNVSYATKPLPDASQFDDFRDEMSEDDIEQQKAEWKKQLAIGQKAAMKEIWERLYETVSHAAKTLEDPDRIYRDTLVGNIKEVVDQLPSLNIGNDQELEKYRTEVEEKLAKLDPQLLRVSGRARSDAAEEARTLERRMAGYMGASNRVFDSLGLTGGK